MEFAIGIILLCLFLLLWLTVLTYKLSQKKREKSFLRSENKDLQGQNEHLKEQNFLLKRYIEFQINVKEESKKTEG